MTLVAAMVFDDQVLMASDRQVTMEGFVDSTPKLNHFPNCPLVWGGAGEEEVINDFGTWAERYNWQDSNEWEPLRQEIRTTVNSLNRAKRRAMREAGSRATSKDLASILIAGYVEGMPNILEVSSKGESYLHAQRGYAAIGSGEPHFRIAKSVVDTFTATYLKQDKLDYREKGLFWFTVKVAVDADPYSGKGLQRCQITRAGINCDERGYEAASSPGSRGKEADSPGAV